MKKRPRMCHLYKDYKGSLDKSDLATFVFNVPKTLFS